MENEITIEIKNIKDGPGKIEVLISKPDHIAKPTEDTTNSQIN